MTKPTMWLCAQRRLRSPWVEAHADLSLRWVHMPFCWFCHAAAHLCSGAQITPKMGPTIARYGSRVKDLYLANSVDPKLQTDLQIDITAFQNISNATKWLINKRGK